MVTAYDYPTAKLLEEAGVEIILVGDSLGTVILGYENTLPVTLEEILHHTKAVSRAVKKPLVVADLPFLSYQVSVEQAILHAGRLLKEGGAQAVKLEGGEEFAPTVEKLVRRGIPVMGHLGLTPQFISQLGGYRVQGKTAKEIENLQRDAKALEEAGVFALVLECVPKEVAQWITEQLSIPTIGIGAGAGCDGQVLVFHDMMGLTPDFSAKFVKQYLSLRETIVQALQKFVKEVEEGQFPDDEHSFHLPESELSHLKKAPKP